MLDSTERSGQAAGNRSVLAINSGSSSLKFALFTFAPEPEALCRGTIDAPARATAAEQLLERVAGDITSRPLAAVGHRVVHGGPALHEPAVVTGELIETLRGPVRFAPNHLPDEIALIEALQRLRHDTP